MATYYGSVFIPSADTSGLLAFSISFANNSGYSGAGTTLDNFNTVVLDLEASYGGDITYNITNVNGGITFSLIYRNPNEIPIVSSFANIDSGNTYNFIYSEVLECTGCGSVQWAECQEDYVINLGLEESTTYDFTLTHNQTGIQYTQTNTTNGSGVTTWDTYLKPELYVSGNVFVLTATNGAEDVIFTYNGTQYSCMQITMVKKTNITD